MEKPIFDEVYFGDYQHAGYSDYIITTKSPQFLKIFDDCLLVVSGKILELGCAIGTYKKLAKAKNIDWTALDAAKWCYNNKESDIILTDALSYLHDQTDNSFDYIVSFNFLECNDTPYLELLKKEMNRVSKNQYHYSTKNPNPKFYNQDIKLLFPKVVS